MPVWNLSQNVSFWGPFWVLMKQRTVFIKKYHLATSNYSNSVVNMTESRNILQRNTGSLRNKVLVQVATFKKRWKQWTLMFSIEIKFSPCLGVLTVIQTILSRQEILGNSGSHASVKILPLFCLSRKWTFCRVPRERLDHARGIEGSAAAQGKELEAPAAEKASCTGVTTMMIAVAVAGMSAAWRGSLGLEFGAVLILDSLSVYGPWARNSTEVYKMLVQSQDSSWKWKRRSTEVSYTRAPRGSVWNSLKWKLVQKLKTTQMSSVTHQ